MNVAGIPGVRIVKTITRIVNVQIRPGRILEAEINQVNCDCMQQTFQNRFQTIVACPICEALQIQIEIAARTEDGEEDA